MDDLIPAPAVLVPVPVLVLVGEVSFIIKVGMPGPLLSLGESLIKTENLTPSNSRVLTSSHPPRRAHPAGGGGGNFSYIRLGHIIFVLWG